MEQRTKNVTKLNSGQVTTAVKCRQRQIPDSGTMIEHDSSKVQQPHPAKKMDETKVPDP